MAVINDALALMLLDGVVVTISICKAFLSWVGAHKTFYENKPKSSVILTAQSQLIT
jgi:hypothetical protein